MTPRQATTRKDGYDIDEVQQCCIRLAQNLAPGGTYRYPGYVFRRTWGLGVGGKEKFLRVLKETGHEGFTLTTHYAPEEDDTIHITRKGRDGKTAD